MSNATRAMFVATAAVLVGIVVTSDRAAEWPLPPAGGLLVGLAVFYVLCALAPWRND